MYSIGTEEYIRRVVEDYSPSFALLSQRTIPGELEYYAGFFPGNPPARSAVEVARLPKDAMVEIEAVAVR